MVEKLSLAFRLMQDDDQTDLGSFKFTGLACLLAFILPWLMTVPLLDSPLQMYRRHDGELAIVILFFTVLIFPARISFFSARAVLNIYYSQSQSWLSLTEITNQELIWAYTLHALYQVRRLLLLGTIVPMAVLLSNRALNVMPVVLCRLQNSPTCAPIRNGEFSDTVILVLVILGFLVGLYLLAASVGVHAALRNKILGLADIASFVNLWIDVVLFIIICTWLFISQGNLIVLVLSVILPYLLALIILRIARSWLWKPARAHILK